MENTDKTRPERSGSRQGIIQPAHGSINAIIRAHGGQQLFVPAIAWTETHLDLLNIRFIYKCARERVKENKDVQVGNAPQDNQGHLILGEQCLRQLKELGTLWPDERKYAIATLLTRFGFEVAKTRGPQDANKKERFAIQHNGFGMIRREDRDCAAKIGFQFGPRISRSASVRLDAIFERPSTGIYVGNINFDSIPVQRKNYVLRRHKMKRGSQALRRTSKLVESMEPSDRFEDPYIAGILIALAQEQRRRGVAVVEDGQEHGAGQRVHAIGYQQTFYSVAFIYTALIPDGFLNGLERPWEFCPNPGILVRYFSLYFMDAVTDADYLWRYWKTLGLVHEGESNPGRQQ
ncbi:hypothetical protein E4U54_004468 [Claviceps lovelessii]|nr:hypothetical protein E4U54_004468 [Claviceps lovelessii]